MNPSPASLFRCLCILALAGSQSACSLFAIDSAISVVNAAGSATMAAVSNYGTTKASNTIYHLNPGFSQLCIEYNRNAQVPDMVPALQAELRQNKIEARVYEAGTAPQQCEIWLRYVATLEWGEPPFSNAVKPYLSAFSLSLHNANGSLLASSSYQLDDQWSSGKWASTQKKVAPVVKALITGFQG